MKGSKLLTRFLVSVILMCAAIAAQSQVNTWVFKAHMLTQRNACTAATGPDGRIYVFGGTDGTNALSSVEAYDPSADTWTYVADMPLAESVLAAVTGPDGRIYVINGDSSFNVYDTSSNSWTPLANSPMNLNEVMAALGNDGRIYAFEGTPADIAFGYAYDINTNTWSTVASTDQTLQSFGRAVTGPDGKIYILGGMDGAFNVKSVWRYDAHADVWQDATPMTTGRGEAAVAVGGDNRIYAVAGYQHTFFPSSSAEAFDLKTNTWSPIPDLPVTRADAGGAAGPDGKIYVFGGYDGTNTWDTVECFQPNLLSGIGEKFVPTEGQAYNDKVATFTDINTSQDASSFTASIDWGDGTNTVGSVVADVNPGSFIVNGNHAYAEANIYHLTITVNDADGETLSVLSQANVVDAPLSGSANNISPSVNIQFSGSVATMTDGNPLATAADFTGSIDWGDGTTTTSTFVDNGSGKFSINGSHTYASQGSFQTKITVNDVDGSKLSLTGSANVTIPPPHITAAVINAQEGVLFNGQVATFTDDSPNISANAFTASINWGDGTTTSGNVASNGSGGFNVTGNHTYSEEGTFSITVTVNVVGGGSSSGIGTASVTDAPLTAVGYSLIEKGLTFSDTVATFTDADPAGTATDFTAGIVWGDGKSSNGTIVAFGSGWKVVGSHSYAKRGKYTATIHIKDAGGATATATTLINVGPVK